MKNKDLIAKLQELPLDMEVCIFDFNASLNYASEEPSAAGVYQNISVYQMFPDKEMKALLNEYAELNNFIAIEFCSENENWIE